MSEKKESLLRTGKLIGSNLLRFLFIVGYIMVYQLIFGPENLLPAVALCVGLTMIPFCDYGVRPSLMVGLLFAFNLGGAAVAQLALVSPWIALPVNIAFVAALFLTLSSPYIMKPFISFILCFVFCQSTPVAAERFPVRLLGIAAATALTAVVTLAVWRRRGCGREGRGLKEQIRLCAINRSLILRMALGLGAAMFLGSILGLKKPLWISIVVMSLTQLEFQESLQRIRHRALGTVLGIILFVVVFRILVPERYSAAMVLLLGYLSFFTSEYKYKQMVNAVSAISASLVLLDTVTAIGNRVLCLLAGVAIVLVLFAGEWLIRRLRRGRTPADGAELLRETMPQT